MSTRFPDVRRPAVAGMFYEANPDALRARLQTCFLRPPGPGALPVVDPAGPREVLGLVVPHAGIVYSGYAAAHAYHRLAQDGAIDVAVILSPNHHGMGEDNAIWPDGVWETPLGGVSVATDIAAALQDACPLIQPGYLPHAHEHAIEVQLPFLQMLYGSRVRIVPIALKRYSLEVCVALGEAIAKVLHGRNGLVIASSDFTHYEPAARARSQDQRALEAIERMDAEELFSRVHEHRITTCGYGPVAAMLVAAARAGARQARILAYTTSGDVTGDHSRVVGYAAVAITR